jgi:hypothetical protein
MKVRFLLLGIALLTLGCSGNTQNANSNGRQVDDAIVDVTLDSLILNARNYESKVVRVSGIVEHVCVHTGKRLTLMGNSPDMKLRVTASETVPEFDISIKGSKVLVTGIFKRVEKSNEICEAESAHHPGELFFIACQNIKVR